MSLLGDFHIMKNIYICFIIIQILVFGECSNILASDNKKKADFRNEKISEKPIIVFEKQNYDFGKIYIGDIMEHGFKFKNDGDGELIIHNVKTSCGCTAALVSKSNLLKDEEGEVKIKFNPGRFVGKVTKAVTVNSNDPQNPSCKLTITGEVREEVSVNPKHINFGIIRKGDSCTRTIEIKIIPEMKTEIKKVESPNSYITITQIKSKGNSSYNYQVNISKYDYIGKFSGMVFVYTNSSKQERIDIPFSGEVIGDITIYPEILSFGNIKINQNVNRTVIVNFVNKDIKIEKIEVDPDIIKYTISELNNNSKKIDVKLGDDTANGKITGSLKIYTNSTIQPVINIPIYGEIKG